ncbi:hypothetical protein [Candidatus Oleimmundimicrobium sp.]|uniref:hypothetical protein n=1 Tax=Candidatus Oleimmundimicrobium sp. TaxID=3060597 RepID=UPI002722E4B1|nr:hypothetical protein [Candidatus Oleimmundimicrobium sp.]MDO8886882.1 hypothetical protein [Candidatus Oleimmundimicrobium sp.]
MESALLSKRNGTYLIGLICFFILIISIFSPAESTLGNWIKVLYIHAGLAIVGIMIFILAGIFGALHLIFKKDSLGKWAVSSQKIALLIWVFNGVLSIFVTKMIWGKWVFLAEPRFKITIFILVVAPLFYLFSLWVDDKKITSALNIILASFVVWLYSTAGSAIFHPSGPARSSSNLLIRLSFFSINGLLFIAALILTWLIKEAD